MIDTKFITAYANLRLSLTSAARLADNVGILFPASSLERAISLWESFYAVTEFVEDHHGLLISASRRPFRMRFPDEVATVTYETAHHAVAAVAEYIGRDAAGSFRGWCTRDEAVNFLGRQTNVEDATWKSDLRAVFSCLGTEYWLRRRIAQVMQSPQSEADEDVPDEDVPDELDDEEIADVALYLPGEDSAVLAELPPAWPIPWPNSTDIERTPRWIRPDRLYFGFERHEEIFCDVSFRLRSGVPFDSLLREIEREFFTILSRYGGRPDEVQRLLVEAHEEYRVGIGAFAVSGESGPRPLSSRDQPTTNEAMILFVLNEAENEPGRRMPTEAVADAVRARFGEPFGKPDGNFKVTLSQMVKRGWLKAGKKGPRGEGYRITPVGKDILSRTSREVIFGVGLMNGQDQLRLIRHGRP